MKEWLLLGMLRVLIGDWSGTNGIRNVILRGTVGAMIALTATPGQCVSLASIFSDGMVLQRDTRTAIFGEANPFEEIRIEFDGQAVDTIADAQGRWRIALAPLAASAEPRTLLVKGRHSIEVRDIVVGDVWLAGGQSNMGGQIREFKESAFAQEIPQANHPLLRVFTVQQRRTIDEPERWGQWIPVTPETVINLSATGYFFGRDLHQHLGVPIGIVVCAWGGTMAENWVSRSTLLSSPMTAPIVERYDRIVASYEGDSGYLGKLAEHQRKLNSWRIDRHAGKQAGAAPREPMGPQNFQRPGGLFETMFRRIGPFSFKGVIFYQGESNVADGRSYQYRYLLPMLVNEWRDTLEQHLPFLVVQLPVIKGQYGDEWAEMRESQAVACQWVKDCELAVVLELGGTVKFEVHGA